MKSKRSFFKLFSLFLIILVHHIEKTSFKENYVFKTTLGKGLKTTNKNTCIFINMRKVKEVKVVLTCPDN